MKFGQMMLAFFLLMAILVGTGWYLSPSRQVEVSRAKIPLFDEEGDHYRRNPFFEDDSPGTPDAKAVVEEEQFQFGSMALGTTGKHEFIIKNEGTAPLKLARGPSQCKCTVSAMDQDEIPPGATASITLEWTPKDLGEFGQEAVIYTSDPNKKDIHFGVRGTMYENVMKSPANGWSLGSLQDKPVTVDGYLLSQIYDSFEITETSTTSDLISVKVEPINPEDAPQPDSKSGYVLTVVITPPEKAGDIREEVVIKTDLEDYPEFRFPVTGQKFGPMSIIGKGWYASGALFQLGAISASKGETRKYTLFLDNFGEDLKFESVKSNPAFLSLKLTKEESPADAARQRYSLVLDIPPGLEKSVWTDDHPGEIVVTTNHPDLQKLTFKVTMDLQ